MPEWAGRLLWDARALWMRRRRVVYSADRAGWILDQVARALCAHLPSECRPGISHGPDLHFLRGRVIHFLGQFDALGRGPGAEIHPSNRLVATWWHGTRESCEPELAAAFAHAVELAPRFERIVVSCSIYERAFRAAGIDAGKIVRLPLGVDRRQFRPATPEERARTRARFGVPPHAFCIGSFQKDGAGWGEGLEPKRIKGPDLLVAVAERLRKEEVFFLLSGPSRGYVRRELERVGVPFAQAGFVPSERMPELYRALDAYLITSREEGGPAALLEAMAAGVPVVTTPVGMAMDVIEEGVNGLRAEVGDVEGLARAMARLMADGPLRGALAARAMETVARYDWERVAREYGERLYRPLFGE